MKDIRSVVLTFACGLACALGLSSCDTYPHDKATAIVTAPYPGKNEIYACKPYADALCKALARNHIQAWSVCYWRNNTFGPHGHAIVVYKDAGAYWCADNAFPYPTKCWGTTPIEWAQEHEALWLADGGNVAGANLYPTASYVNPNANYVNLNAVAVIQAKEGNTLLAEQTHGANHPATVAQRVIRHYNSRVAGIVRKASKERYANGSTATWRGQ